MRCPTCQFDNEAGAQFCANCGATIRSNNYQGANNTAKTLQSVRCPNCGTTNTADSLFCESCGTKLGQQAVSDVPLASSAQITTQKSVNKTSWAWWLLPLFLTWVGGVIAWVVVRENDRAKAKRLLIFGILMIFVWTLISIVGYILLVVMGSRAMM